MDFIEEIRNLSAGIEKQKDLIKNEEATKTACVLPFIELLEYEIYNLREVVPEHNADFGTKKGEKVDYAIFKDDEVIMLIECKPFGTDLADVHISQLYRYFSVLRARIAILTDGDLYQFYTDLEETNKMDSKPFLEFNMLNVQEQWVNELKRFTKSTFNLDAILTAAIDLKYTKEIKRIMIEQLEAPSEDFVRFFLSSVYSGEETQAVVQQFTDIVRRVLNEFLREASKEEEDKHWTAERFKALVSKSKYIDYYESQSEIEKLCEFGADLMALRQREQWKLTYKFNKYYFALYFEGRRVFGINLLRHPKLVVWLRKDILDARNDELFDGKYTCDRYDNSHGWGAYPKHVTVANIEDLLKFAYGYRVDSLS